MSILKDIIIMWTGTNASIPSGFTRETALDDYFIRGVNGGASGGSTGGNSSHSHSSSGHTHTMNSHTHQVHIGATGQWDNNSDMGGTESFDADHLHTANLAGVVGGSLQSTAVTYASSTNNNNPEHRTVIFIKSIGYKLVPNNASVFWDQGSLPSGFDLDTDYLGKYIKGASAGADAGTNAGSNTHTHDISHTHTSDTHYHTGSIAGGYAGDSARATGGGSNYVSQGHTHNVTLNSSTSNVDSATITASDGVTIEPPYQKLGFIKNSSGVFKLPKGIIGLWLGSQASIPTGWSLKTVSDKYLKCADNLGQVDNTGGTSTHTHSAYAHTHTGTSHSHTLNYFEVTHDAGQRNQNGVGGSRKIDKGRNDHYTGDYTPNANTTTFASANTTADSSNNEPIYKTVCFIKYEFSADAGFLLNFV